VAELRVRTEEGSPLIGLRVIPLRHLVVTDALLDFATVRPGVMLRVRQLSVANVTGSAATLTLHSVPPTASATDANAELKGLSVGANSAVDLTPLVGGLYEAGTKLRAVGSASGALVLHGWAEELL
jgi:hypothetical protein